MVKPSVSKLPSGIEIDIFAHVFRIENPGPTVLFLGGLHGVENQWRRNGSKTTNT